MRKILSGFWVLVLGFGEEVSAGIVHVPGDHSTLQAAVNAASPGDIVLVAAGTYRGAGNHDIDFGGKGLTVRGEAGARSTVIDCEGQGRAFRFPPDEPAGALLAGFTLMCIGDILFAHFTALGRADLDPLIHVMYILAYAAIARGAVGQYQLLH